MRIIVSQELILLLQQAYQEAKRMLESFKVHRGDAENAEKTV